MIIYKTFWGEIIYIIKNGVFELLSESTIKKRETLSPFANHFDERSFSVSAPSKSESITNNRHQLTGKSIEYRNSLLMFMYIFLVLFLIDVQFIC